MNLVLLFPEDFLSEEERSAAMEIAGIGTAASAEGTGFPDRHPREAGDRPEPGVPRRDRFASVARVRLAGRRAQHVVKVHRAEAGRELVVGLANGPIGRGRVESATDGEVLLDVVLDRDPPPPSPITLVLALPRPKVVNRTVAAASSLGIKAIHLVNAWRVEKAYWSSPRLEPDNLREQAVLGLEQGRDSLLPTIELHRFLRPFAEERLPAIAGESLRLFAHPGATEPCPRAVPGPVTLLVGPEGGWIAREVEMFERLGFRPVSIGERILRVETAVAVLAGRLG